jgi:hypothetical protein
MCNITAEDGKKNAGGRLRFNRLASDTSSQQATTKMAASSSRVTPYRSGYTASIPDAPVLLKSNRPLRIASFKSLLATKSRELSETFMASGSEVTGASKTPKLDSERSQRLDPSSQLSVNCTVMGRSQRHETFKNRLSTESDELGKASLSSDSKAAGSSNICGFIGYDKSQRISRFTSQRTVESSRCSTRAASDCGAGGTADRIRFLESPKLETSAGQSKSEASQCAGTNTLRKPFLRRSNKSTSILGVTSQNEMESHEPGKALADNHGEMGTKFASTVLVPLRLQSDGSRTYPHVAAETSGTATSSLLRSRIPQRVSGHVRESMKEFEEHDGTSSSLPTTNKSRYARLSQGSFLMRREKLAELDAKHCNEPFVELEKLRLSSVEQRVAPVYVTSANSHTLTSAVNPEITKQPTIAETREHNILTPYSGRITPECLQMKTKQSPRVSGINDSIGMGTAVTRSKRKRSLEESAGRNICTASDSPLKRRYEEENCGKPDNHTECSLLHSVAASRLVEKALEPKMHVELKITKTAEMYRSLNVATEPGNELISTDELQYPVERTVSLMTKPPGISAVINCPQNSSNNSPMTRNRSTLVSHKKNEVRGALHESSRVVAHRNSPLNETFLVASRGTSTVSVATQTDLIMKSNAPVQTDNLICCKSAVAKILALYKSQQTQLDALLKKQTDVISNGLLSILNEELDCELFTKGSNHSSDAATGYNYKNSEESQVSRRSLRRSERIAAWTSLTVAGEGTVRGSKSVPATPVRPKHHDSPSSRGLAKKLKSLKVYEDLRSSFRFLKTPQSTRRPNARTPKNTPARIVSQRLQDQLLSLYD